MTGFTDPARAGDFICGSSWQDSAHTEQWWASPEPDTDHVHVTREDQDRAAATAEEAWVALNCEGPTAAAVQSYLSPGPVPKFDGPQAEAEAGQ